MLSKVQRKRGEFQRATMRQINTVELLSKLIRKPR